MAMVETPDDNQVGAPVDPVPSPVPQEADAHLSEENDATFARTLEGTNPAEAVRILWDIPSERRQRVLAAAAPEWAEQWPRNHEYQAGTIGRLMAPPFAYFRENMTVAEATEILRGIVKKALMSYAFVVDAAGRLIGVLVFREMMLAEPQELLSDVMLRDPVYLDAATPIMDAMREILKWHYPAYPVCDGTGRLVGIIRGQTLFQQQAVELSAQAGAMVGVEKEERLGTPWARSLRFRHPWLQLNLLTAFVAAMVVGIFQGTIDRIVALAVFLPVLAGQSGNTGSQALAITLRGMTLGETRPGGAAASMLKEAWLGLLNGALVGVTAGLGMLAYAISTGTPAAATLALVVAIAMTGACVLSGISGVVIPVAMRRIGADPATASSIFLTTVTDCVSMGLFLGLATLLIP
jgi:magnesium transporter